MKINATYYAMTAQARSTIVRKISYALFGVTALSACVANQTVSKNAPDSAESKSIAAQLESDGAMSLDMLKTPNAETDEPFSAIPSAPQDPKDFALDLVSLMGTSPNKCGAAAENTPQVNWTCAEYTKGLAVFIANWDKLIRSPAVSRRHNYTPTSDWMIFEVDGKIDFFWKTYDLEKTQALVAYDPSEKGNELIIGLNPIIGNQIAAADGSHKFISSSKPLTVRK